MEITQKQQKITERYSPSDLLSLLAYSPDDDLYFHEEKKHGSLSFCYMCYPMMGVDESRIQQLQVLLSQDFPAGTIIQATLWTSPDIEQTLFTMNAIRNVNPGDEKFKGLDIAKSLIKRRTEYLRKHTSEPMSDRTPMRVRDIQIAITVKVPCSGMVPTDRDIESTRRLRRATEQILSTLGMAPVFTEPESLLRLLGSIVNWDDNASWRSSALLYDSTRLIRDQVFDTETTLRVDEDGLWVGKKRVKTLCVKRAPEYVHLAQAAQFLGDYRTGQRGIRENILITLNILFPDAEEARTTMGTKKNTSTWQAMGPLSKYVPRLKMQKESYDCLFEALEDGDRVVKAYLSFVVFGDDEDEATAASSNLITYYRELGYRLQEDRYISLPIFLNALPLGAERGAEKNLMRYRTMAGRHAAQMLPVLGDWKGTGTPVFTLLSRNGQLMSIDLFDSPTNYSAVVAAESGSGKSFFVQAMMNDYLSLGASIYVIDVGRSFKNSCRILGGDHLEFTPDSNISMNPFTTIIDYEEQSDLLIAVLIAMISPAGKINEYQIAMLCKIVSELWGMHGNKLNIDILAETLENYRDQEGALDKRVNDLGAQLFRFTSKGEYGKWFNKPATIDFTNALTVCELVELKERKHLQKVVLVQLISVISRSMYLGDESRHKLLIIDEGWDLITEGVEGDFIERGVRQLRKHKGGAILILQSVNDLYKTSVGEAIAENTAHKFLMGQTAEAIDGLISKGRLSLSEAAGDLLKTVHTRKGEYSEIFVYARGGAGIGRLTVDRYSQLMFTTDPDEKAALTRRLDSGMGLDDAIDDIINSEKQMKKVC